MTNAAGPSGGTEADELAARFGAGAAVEARIVLAVATLRQARPALPLVATAAREIRHCVDASPVIPARIRCAIVFI